MFCLVFLLRLCLFHQTLKLLRHLLELVQLLLRELAALQQFQQFKANFQGDPKAEVEKLLQSGRLNQRQLNQLQQMAKQFQSLMQ